MLHTDEDPMKSQEDDWLITTAHWRDYSQLVHLEHACFRSEDFWPFWDLLGILTLPGFIRLKAVVKDSMVGFIGGERESGHKRGWVTTLGVLPEYRRQGIGLALLEKCEAMLATPAIRLSVRASNQGAVELYEQAGYRRVDRWQKYYSGGEDALVYEKNR
jgi:ribosomal-protein-alanine N-acetyltransferase